MCVCLCLCLSLSVVHPLRHRACAHALVCAFASSPSPLSVSLWTASLSVSPALLSLACISVHTKQQGDPYHPCSISRAFQTNQGGTFCSRSRPCTCTVRKQTRPRQLKLFRDDYVWSISKPRHLDRRSLSRRSARSHTIIPLDGRRACSKMDLLRALKRRLAVRTAALARLGTGPITSFFVGFCFCIFSSPSFHFFNTHTHTHTQKTRRNHTHEACQHHLHHRTMMQLHLHIPAIDSIMSL